MGFAVPAALASGIQYIVTVNTTGAPAQGYIDLEFNQGPLTTQPASADIVNFSTDGSLIPPGTNSGESTGQLPGTVTLGNGTSYDDYIEGINFGTSITFDLDLSGPAISNPNGDGGGTFMLDFLSSDQNSFLFTNDSANDVPVLTVDVNGDGSTTATTYASASNGPPVVTVSGPFVLQTVPEPSAWLLLLAGLGVLALARCRGVRSSLLR